MFFDQKRDILRSQFLIEDPFGIDDEDRTLRAKAVTTGDHDLHFIGKSAVFQFG
jgi:hypothetical protein